MKRMKREIKSVFDDNEYLNDLQKRQGYLRNIKECIDSPFGVILIQALEQIERDGYATLYKTWLPHKSRQAKANIKAASLLKNTIMGYSAEKEAFDLAVRQYQEMELGEYNE